MTKKPIVLGCDHSWEPLGDKPYRETFCRNCGLSATGVTHDLLQR